MWVQLAEKAPAKGRAVQVDLANSGWVVVRGKDGEIYVAEDAVPPLRQPLLGSGGSVDGRLLRANCRLFGTRFDLRSGQVQGPWCPGVERGQQPLVQLWLLWFLALLLRHLVKPQPLRVVRSRLHEGRLEVELPPLKRCWDAPLALARWLLVPREAPNWAHAEVELQVLPGKSNEEMEEVKISAVAKGCQAELGKALLRLPRTASAPQMAALVRQCFSPTAAAKGPRVAVWVAQYVQPEARGLGLDQRLFSKILDVLHTRGFDFVLLVVDGRTPQLVAQLQAHYEGQGFVKIAEPNAMGLMRAMLRPVRSAAPSAERATGADAVPVASAFQLAHGYVALPLLQEFVQLLPALRAGRLGVKPGPAQVLLRAMMVLGYVERRADGSVGVIESEELQAWERLLAEPLEPYEVPCLASLPKLLAQRRRRLETQFAKVAALLEGALLTPLLVLLLVARQRGLKELEDQLLLETGLGTDHGGAVQMTTSAPLALQRCQMMLVAVSYAPMLAKFQHVLREEPSWGFQEATELTELHVDRGLNVWGSGLQHQAFFRQLLELLGPLFSGDPQKQPRYVADTGCGDGSLLLQIYDFVRTRTPRGQQLEEFPLTLIGIDLNEASLRAAKETLRAVPCELLAGDIGQPGAICEELRRRGVDCRQVLHVRSFLDHDRPFLPPQRRPEGARARFVRHHFVESAYLDKAGNLLAAEEVYQSLVEHLQRWAEILNGHGLCMLEAMLLDVPTTRRYFEDNVSFHFDIEAALSRQYLVPAVPFCMALAEAGLFSSLQGWRCFPESGEYCRILTQHLRRQPFRVRLADHRDLDTLESLQTPGPLQVSRAQLEQRLRLAPLGALLAEAADGPLAAIYTTRLPEESLARAEIEQVSQGPVLQIIALMAAPEAPGVGALLRDFVLQLAQVEGGETCIGLSRCGSWAGSGLGMEDYIRRHQSGELCDKVLGFHTQRGAKIVGLAPGARPVDVENQG
ncbi:unnamed protein product, partial [Effrenium voratum]